MASGASLVQKNLLLADIKRSEQGEATIIRLLNPTGEAQMASVRFDRALLGPFNSVVEVDLMERPMAASSAKLDEGNLNVRVGPYAMVSVRLTR